MLTLLTSPQIAEDRRLKVLWIEDKLFADPGVVLSRYFSIWRAWRPDDISEKLNQELKDIKSQRGIENIYNLPSFPFDGFLADFNLEGAGKDPIKREGARVPLPKFKEVKVATDSQTIGSNAVADSLADMAVKAEAAGLTAAVLTALNFESHPAVIVPYTAYPTQLFQQRALIRLLAPSSIVIAHGAELDLSKESLEKKLEQLSEFYRMNLPKWAEQGIVDIPYTESARLTKLIQDRLVDDKGQKKIQWDAEDAIIVDTVYGSRMISFRSLWYRQDLSDPHLEEVESWIAQLPVPQQTYLEAKSIAHTYWRLGTSDEARDRYTLSRLIRTFPHCTHGEILEVKSQIERLCRHIGIDADTAIREPNKVEITSEKWFVDHLLSLSNSRPVKRLAVLMLVVKAMTARQLSNIDDVAAEFGLPELEIPILINKVKQFVQQYGPKLKAPTGIKIPEAPIVPENDAETIAFLLHEMGIHELEVADDGTISVFAMPPLQPKDIAIYIDPKPKQLLTADEHFTEGRIGVALKRHKIKLEALFSGEGTLAASERRVLQSYARELDLPPAYWPKWLRRGWI
jgi:hypothetical protein